MKGYDARFDRSGLVFEFFLSRRKEKDELWNSKGFNPGINVDGVVKDNAPDRIEKRGKLSAGSFWAVAKNNNLGVK